MQKISIIIPVYNAQDTIGKCIESILNNSHRDYEVILINDGSADNSWAVLEKYKEKYPEKIRIHNQENQGVAKTRNKGIGLSEGEYVMFVDNDDFVDADYLERLASEMDSGDWDLVIGGYRRVSTEKVMFEVRLENVQWSKYIVMAPWAKIYRKSFILDNSLEFLDNNIGEDVYFNLTAINCTDKIKIIDYLGYNWFYNEKSVSNTKQKNIGSNLNVMRLLESCYEKLSKIGAENKPENEFYYVRYVIWYLLFAGKKSEYEKIAEEYEKLFSWLKEKYPNFGSNINISLFRPKGEALKNRLVISIFLFLRKIGMTKTFLKVYSRI